MKKNHNPTTNAAIITVHIAATACYHCPDAIFSLTVDNSTHQTTSLHGMLTNDDNGDGKLSSRTSGNNDGGNKLDGRAIVVAE
eukprot:13284006-Ditylum_brightwellii.AAC.1